MSGQITSTEKKRRFYMFSALGIVAMAIILFASFTLFSPPKQETPSSLRTTAEAQGGAGGVGSPEYNRKLEKHEDRKADEALKTGESHIPQPVGKRGEQLVTKKADTPPRPVAPPVQQQRPTPTRQQRPDEMGKRMMDDLAKLDTKLNASMGQGVIAYIYEFPEEKTEVGQPASVKEASVPSISGMKTGDLLYAVVDIAVNSDVPSPVMATVATGKHRKTKLIGKFQRHDERLVLTFSRALLPDGQSLKVEAYAVDPNTTEGSVASSVDTHFFSRWGGLIASAFLEGLGEAKRYSGAESTVYANNYGTSTTDQMVWNDYSVSDQAWIAAGKVGEKATRIFERNFDRPPTVYLNAGSPIGILIMNTEQ